jgi:hypothetical protein
VSLWGLVPAAPAIAPWQDETKKGAAMSEFIEELPVTQYRAITAGRLIAKLWAGSITPDERKRLAKRAPFCPACFAYQLPTHRCWERRDATAEPI